MTLHMFVCPICGVVKLQNVSAGEYPAPMCQGDGARVHSSAMSFVYDVTIPAATANRTKGEVSE